MAVETAKDKIKLNQLVGQKQEIITVDGDVIVNDVKPDILKVLNTNGTICVYKKEVLNGKVKLEGCINTYIIYLADDEMGSIRTINTKLDFSEAIVLEKVQENMAIEEKLCIKGFEAKVLNSRKVHVKAFIEVGIKVFSSEEVEAIVDIQNEGDIQTKNSIKCVKSLIGENTGKTVLKDTINIKEDDDFAEIMRVNMEFSDIETKTSYNKVLIKANANVNIMYLTEDNRISNCSGKIPVMGFIDMPDITDTSECMAKILLKNLEIKYNNIEENSIYVEADLELLCRAFENREINVIEDAYSIYNNLDLKRSSVKATTMQNRIRDIFKIREVFTNSELIYGTVLGVNVSPGIENTEIRDGEISYTGKLDTEFFVNNDNMINVVSESVPLEFNLINELIDKKMDFETQINIIEQRAYNTDDGVVLDVEMEIIAMLQNNEKLSFIQDIETLDEPIQDIYSMVIYFVKPGDTLWEIAKQFRSRVEDIARVNEIEDANKIYVGQQLYIPKFTRNRVTM